MKRILIVEDEQPAAKRLLKLIQALDTSIEIVGMLDSVEEAVDWFKENPEPDLAFFDIQLADGLSFQIFEQVSVNCLIIFTTAYDQYAIKAFKVNSIDYLLKPIDPEELKRAWSKFENLGKNKNQDLKELVQAFNEINQKKNYKERFLIKSGEQFKYLTTQEAAYFFSEDGTTYLVDQKGTRYIVDDKLDYLETVLDPRQFFRINRKFIIQEMAIQKILTHYNSRLKLELQPVAKDEVIVARERVGEFKKWLDQ